MKIKKTKKYAVEYTIDGDEFAFYGGHMAALKAYKACKKEGLDVTLRKLPQTEWR